VVAVHAADRERVGDLPQEHDRKEDPRFGTERAPCRRPAGHRRQRPGYGAHQGTERAHALEGRIEEQVDDRDRGGHYGGEGLHGDDGRHASAPRRTPAGSTVRAWTSVTRVARSVRTRQVARMAAPTTRCAVVGRTARRDQIVSAPRVTWRMTRPAASSAGRRTQGSAVWRSTYPAVEPTAAATKSAPTRCAKWTAM